MLIKINRDKTRIGKINPRILNVAYVIFLCTFLFGGVVTKEFKVDKQEVPLLLNSGLTSAPEAELRIVLWFEKKPNEAIKQSLPQDGWEWNESELKASEEMSAYTLSGYKVIHPEEEERLFPWFQKFSKEVKDYGGIVYFDERVPEGMDIANYFVQQGIIPVQWALSENTQSVTGRTNKLLPRIQVGQDTVNIQLLSQTNGDGGRTVLAIPVLLEEF